MEMARTKFAFTVGMTGADGGKVATVADIALKAPTNATPRIQEAHLFLGHELCHMVEAAMVGGSDV